MFPAAPGQPLRIGAADYNAAVEAGREWLRTRRLGTGGRVATPAIDHAVVWVRNSTSGALPRGAVLELSTPLLSSVGPRRLWFDGIERGSASPVCAVLLDPAPQLGIVQAAIAGVVVADVDIQDADNTHVRVESGSSVFVGDFGGPARILYKPSGTGVKECVLQLGVNSSVVRKAVADEDIATGASGDVSVYIDGADVGTVTAHLNWRDVSGTSVTSGDEIFIQWFDDEEKWIVVPDAMGQSGGLNLLRLYSGSWKSQYSTTSYLVNGYPADLKFTYYNGSPSDCGVTVTGDGASAYNTPLLTFDQAGLYLLIPNVVAEINDSGVSYTETVTTSAASAGTSHTHTVDCPVRHFGFASLSAFKRASGATLWGAAKATSAGSLALMKGNVFNGSSNGTSVIGAPMYIRDVTAGDELLLRCFGYHTPASGTIYYTYQIVECTLIRVGDDPGQSTVT